MPISISAGNASSLVNTLLTNVASTASNAVNRGLSLATSRISNAIDSKLANQHSQNIDNFKARLGTGFRHNMFGVTFNFVDIDKNTTTDSTGNQVTTTTTTKGSETSLWKQITKDILLNPNYMSGENVNKRVLSIGDIKKYITSLKNKNKGGGDSSTNLFPLLCTGFQLPGAALELTGDIVKQRKYVKNNNPGVCTATILNDQWNINYNFCRNYINAVADGKGVYYYPDEYKFIISVSLYDNAWNEYQTIMFKNCTMTSIGDIDLNKGTVTDIKPFTVNIDYEDYAVVYHAPTFRNFGFAGSINSKEIENIVALNVQYTALQIASKASNIIPFGNPDQIIELLKERKLVDESATKAKSEPGSQIDKDMETKQLQTNSNIVKNSATKGKSEPGGQVDRDIATTLLKDNVNLVKNAATK